MCSATHSLHVELIAQFAAAGICWCGGTPTMAEASVSSSCRRGASRRHGVKKNGGASVLTGEEVARQA